MRKILFVLLFSATFFGLFAQEAETSDSVEVSEEAIQNYIDSVSKSFTYETGEVLLPGGYAKIMVPKGMKYLNPEQSKTVLVDLWGNPSADGTLGMLFPEKYNPMDANAWAFDISFDEMGYVKDDDAEDMNYDEVLEDLKKGVQESNIERKKAGYETVQLMGWASSPFYDKERKVLHWAKELKFGEEEENTLNYDVRVLGRKGVLSLNAVGSMKNLPEVKPVINYLLSSVEFTSGNKYADFDPDLDHVAAWTVGGLVAGKVLAKVGFFAIFLKYIKIILIAVAAAFGGLWKWLTGRKKKKEEEMAQSTPAVIPHAEPEPTVSNPKPEPLTNDSDQDKNP